MFIILLLVVARRGVQHRLDARHGREGQALGHRDPAHRRRLAAQHPRDLPHAGRRHRRDRHAQRRAARRADLGQSRSADPRARSAARHALPRREGVLHERPAGDASSGATCCRSASLRSACAACRRSIHPGARRGRSRPKRCDTNDITTMPNLVLACSGLVKHFQQGDTRVEVLKGVDLDDRRGRARRDRRRLRLGQDDAAAAARRPGSADVGHRDDRRASRSTSCRMRRAASCAIARWASSTSSITCCRNSPRWRTSRCRC